MRQYFLKINIQYVNGIIKLVMDWNLNYVVILQLNLIVIKQVFFALGNRKNVLREYVQIWNINIYHKLRYVLHFIVYNMKSIFIANRISLVALKPHQILFHNNNVIIKVDIHTYGIQQVILVIHVFILAIRVFYNYWLLFYY